MTALSSFTTDPSPDQERTWSEAVFANDFHLVDTMLNAGWPVNRIVYEPFPSWKTALLVAARHADSLMGLRLLDAGASVHHADAMGITPLMEACFFGAERLVERLIAEGAALDVQSVTGLTPMHWAARQGHDRLVGHLLDAGANPHLMDHGGETPLAMAMSGPVVKHTAVADRLVLREQAALRAVLVEQDVPTSPGRARARL